MPGCQLFMTLLLACLACASAHAGSNAERLDDAPSMRAAYQRMQEPLRTSALDRALSLSSAETANGIRGEVFAELLFPFAHVRAALRDPAHWCEAMLAHINTKECELCDGQPAPTLAMRIVRKYDQPLDQAFRLQFNYRVVADEDDFLAVELASAEGPLGTSNYRIQLHALALADGKTFLHMSYAYDSNAMARLATQLYLATFGSQKVGFTIVGRTPGGSPQYIRGMRGLVERNAMRYFLAIEASLQAGAGSADARYEKRLDDWFSGTARYPTQLREVDRATYLGIKRADRSRAQARP